MAKLKRQVKKFANNNVSHDVVTSKHGIMVVEIQGKSNKHN